MDAPISVSLDEKSGEIGMISASGAVTGDNIGAIKGLYEANGKSSLGLNEGMIASYSVNPSTGQGTASASDNAETTSGNSGKMQLDNATVSTGGKTH